MPSNALEKKSQVMLWRRSAEQRIASEMHRKEPHRKSYACPGHARAKQGKATAKNRCTAHWN